jgi:hypothetical protein
VLRYVRKFLASLLKLLTKGSKAFRTTRLFSSANERTSATYRKPSGNGFAAKRSGVSAAGNRRWLRTKAEFMGFDIGGKMSLSTYLWIDRQLAGS